MKTGLQEFFNQLRFSTKTALFSQSAFIKFKKASAAVAVVFALFSGNVKWRQTSILNFGKSIGSHLNKTGSACFSRLFNRLSVLPLALPLCLVLLIGVGNVWGQATTVISNVAGGGTLPTNWTSSNGNATDVIDKTSYYLLETTGSGIDQITTGNYDLSTYSYIILNVDITSFGTGNHRALKIEVSSAAGSTFTALATSYLTSITTGSYVTQKLVIVAPSGGFTTTTKFRFSHSNSSGRGIRLQNINANAPTQASSVTFSSVATTSFTLNWTDGSNGSAGRRAVFIAAASTGTAAPVNGTTYTGNTTFQSGTQIGSTGWYCVYNNTGTHTSGVSVTGLSSGTTYRVMVCEYEGSGATSVFNTSAATNNPNNQATSSPTFSVTYNSNSASSGSVPTDATAYSSGASVNTAANSGSLARTGYTFSGWNTAADGTGTTYAVSTSSAFTISSNTTLYARWTAAVTYDANSATSGSVPADATAYRPGQAVTTPANSGTLARTGYTFAGWNTAADGTGTTYAVSTSSAFNISGNTTLYARWTASVTYDANSATSGSVPSDAATYRPGQAVSTAANSGSLARAGYSFAGWNTLADGTGTAYAVSTSNAFNISGNTTLYAKWDLNAATYSVTYDANSATSGTVPTDATAYSSGASVTTAANSGSLARTGYTFAGWNTAADGTGTSYAVSTASAFAISSNTTLYARWSAAVTYDANSATSGSVPTDATAYRPGQSITTAANSGTLARTSYTFAGWNTAADGSGTSYSVSQASAFNISGNTTLYARWTATVTYNANSATSGSVPTDATAYRTGQAVTTAANSGTLARTGYTFAGWNTAADGTGTIYAVSTASAFTISGNITLFARWTATVTYNTNSASSGSVPTDATAYRPGQAVTTAANSGSLARTGYTFAGWNTAVDGTGTSYSVSQASAFNISGDVTLYARWTGTVSYDANAATGGLAPSAVTYRPAQTVTVASNSGSLVKTGFIFGGWNTAADGTGTNYTAGSGTFSFAGNTTLYAKWNTAYTVTYNSNGGTGSQTDASSPYASGSNVTVLGAGTIARSGFVFSGWNTSADGSGTSYAVGATFAINANATLYAQWISVIAIQDFETSPATPTWTYSGGGGTNNAASRFNGARSYRIAGSETLTMDNFSIAGYSDVVLSVAFAATGVDTDDDLFMDISYDNGSTWTGTGSIKLVDGYSNASININTTSASNPTTVGSNPWPTAIDASETQISVRFRNVNSSSTEYYWIDDVRLTGLALPYPILTTPTATSITTISATLGATITSQGGSALTARGTVYGTTSSPTGNALAEGGTSVAAFSHSRSGLTANTLYNYRGYAINTQGTGYSANGTFTTLPLAPAVGSGSSIISDGFTANWSHPTMGNASYTYTVEVDDDIAFGSINSTTPSISSSSTSQAITGLSASTTYYYRIKAVNAQGSSDWSSTSAGITTLVASSPTNYFRSNVASGNWGTAASWQSSPDNSSWITATLAPTSSAAGITILTGHTITVAAAATAKLVTINDGGVLTLTSSLTISNVTGTDLQVDGTLNRNSGGSLSNVGTAVFSATGIYNQTIVGTVPTATWNAASNCNITISSIGTTYTASTFNLAQTFGNFTWNCSHSAGDYLNVESSSFAVAGTLTIGPNSGNLFSFNNSSTSYTNSVGSLVISGGSVNVLGSTGAVTLNVTNDLSLSGTGTQLFVLYGTGTGILNVGRDITISGSATIEMKRVDCVNAATINITRDFTATSTNAQIVDFGTGVVSNSTINIGRHFSKTGTGTFHTASSSVPGGFVFNGGGATQTFSYSGTTSQFTSYTIAANSSVQLLTNLTLGTAITPRSHFNVNGTLDFQTYSIIAGNTTDPQFNTSATAVLQTSNTNGLGGTSATGSLQSFGTVGTTSVGGRAQFIAGTSYVFNGNTSTPFPSTFGNPKNITVNASVTNNYAATLVVDGAFTINNGGTFVQNGTNNIQLNTSASLTVASGGTYDNGGNSQLIIGSGSPTISITGTFITRDPDGFVGSNTSIPSITPTLNAGSTIVYGLSGNQSVQGTTAPTYQNVTFSGSGTKTLASANAVAGTIYVTGTALLDVGINSFGGAGTNLTVDNGASYKTSGTGTKPDAAGAYTLGATSSIEFYNNESTQQNIRLTPTTGTVSYGNIIVSGSNVGLSGTTSSVSMNSGSTFTVTSTGTFNCQSTLGFTGSATTAVSSTNNPSISLATGSTINYNHTSSQPLTARSDYSNLTISGGGDKTLGGDATVIGTLTLSNGKLIVSSTKTLSIGNNSVNGEIVGGSNTSYIVAYGSGSSAGTLKRFVNTAASTIYNLPIGDLAAYTPMTFTLASATLSNAFITIYTNPASIPSLNSSLVSYLDRYWDLTPSGITSPTYSVIYTYVTADINGVETDFFPVKRSFTGPSSYTWYKPEGADFSSATAEGTGTADLASNTLLWSGLTTFSLFSAAGDEFVTLPISIVSFDARKQGQNNVVFWSAITEENCDYYTVEKTLDGTNYEIVGKINSGGNSSSILDYSLIDYDVRKTLNYYRLKETNTDGGEKMSTIIAVDNRENTGKEVLKTLNILGQEIDENYKGIVIVLFEDGTSIKKVQ